MADLKNPAKADLNKDGKLSPYEKKRGAAIEKAMDKSEGMSRAQQAAIAIAKMKKEELAELVREVLAETEVEEAVTQMHVTAGNKADIKAALKKKGVTDTSSVDKAKPGEVIAVEELTSVGHVDDEPGMLKQFAYDTADYAAKLYKLLHHYEQMEDHVDFPNWWQHKVMMAREYMSKATHYLEFETMKPHLDAKIDGHSEEELDEDYVPRTKEDLVFQYLRDAWQFGAMKGKDVNPDEELSTMADSLLANLPDYDAAARVDEQAESLQSIGQKIEGKLKALGLQTRVFGGEFEVPKKAKDMIGENPKLGAMSYSRGKSVVANAPESERLQVVVHKDHLEDLKKIANEFKMPSGTVQAFSDKDWVKLTHTADVVSESAELSELFSRAKNKIVNYQGHDYEILDIDNAGTFTLIDPKHKFYVNKNQMKQGRVPDVKEPEVEDVPLMNLKEDDIAAPAAGFEDDSAKAPKGDKKLNKAASKNDKIISTYKKIKPLFKKAAAGDKEALAVVKANQDVIKAYKKLTQTHLAENKATCCGKCGRTHVKGTECKKPFLTGKDHCRVR